MILLLQAAVLIAGPWALWRLAGFHHIAPLAVLQIIVGVLLGPSVFGAIAPAAQAAMFPAESVIRIGAIAQIAVVLYSFVTGMHLDSALVRATNGIGIVALGSFVLPMAAGTLGAAGFAHLYPQAAPAQGDMLAFSLACGLLVSVTALPVLAALLKEKGLLFTPFGQRALGLAAINDAFMWICVALLLVLFAVGGEGATLSLLPVYAAGLIGVAWLLRRFAKPENIAGTTVLMCAFAPLSAWVADHAGLGYVVGAFAAGVIVPASLRAHLVSKLEWPALFLLMPFFFMATGLRVDARLLSAEFAGMVAALTLFAMLTKIGGTALAARLAGQGWREGIAIGIALQTKGLMEVLVATILVDRGIIGEAMFGPLVLMALLCTMATAPLLHLLGVRPARALSEQKA